jgi:hypothetical protein
VWEKRVKEGRNTWGATGSILNQNFLYNIVLYTLQCSINVELVLFSVHIHYVTSQGKRKGKLTLLPPSQMICT